MIEQETLSNVKSVESEKEDFQIFWYFELANKKGDLIWKIDHRKLIGFIHWNGFRRFDIGNEYIFILITQRVIEEIQVTRIQDEVMSYINSLSDDFLFDTGIKRSELESKFYTSPVIFFNERKLSMLGPEPNLLFNSDTKENAFIYYSNGFVKCSAEGYQLHKYKELEGHIFKKQIRNRKFIKHSSEGMFKQFVFNISGKNEDRFLSLKTMIGYLLHGFYETKMKAVNLTDSTISDVAEGRTGKTLLGMGISQVKNVCIISGKDFDPANKHKYATASLDTQVVFLNDLRKNFIFEHLFNDISDAITVDRKNLQPFQIRAKIMIAANDTFRVEGASAKDRVIEFELSEHYNAEFSPSDEFGCWFFTEWEEEEWLAFDNFMLECVSTYLKHGIIEAESINLDQRKKIQHTNGDFVEFMDEKIKDKEIKTNFDYDKKELHNEFLEKFPEYKEDRWLKRSANFTKYMKIYASYSPQLKGTVKERRSAGKSIIRFETSKIEQSKLPF